MFIKRKKFINWFWRWWMLFFSRKTFFWNNFTFASWLYFVTIKNNDVNCNWNRVDCTTKLISFLKNILLSLEFSSYFLLCFWISSIVTIFVVYYIFFLNVLRLFMNNGIILFFFYFRHVVASLHSRFLLNIYHKI